MAVPVATLGRQEAEAPSGRRAGVSPRAGVRRLSWAVVVATSALAVAVGVTATAITAGPGPAAPLLDVVPAAVTGYLELDPGGSPRESAAGPSTPPLAPSSWSASRLLAALGGLAVDEVATLPSGARRLLTVLLTEPAGPPVGFTGTAALAVLPGDPPTSASGRPLLVLGVQDPAAARAQLLSTVGPATDVAWDGHRVWVGGDYAAVVANASIVLGNPEAIGAFLRAGDGPALAANPRLRTALAALPGDHLALAWFDLLAPSADLRATAAATSASDGASSSWVAARLFATPSEWGLEVVWPWSAGPDLVLRRDHLAELLPAATLLLIDLPSAEVSAAAVGARLGVLPGALVPADLPGLLATLPGAVGREVAEEWGLAVVDDGGDPVTGVVTRAADPTSAEAAAAGIRRALAARPPLEGAPLAVAAVGSLVLVARERRFVDAVERGETGPRLAEDRSFALMAAEVGTTNEAFLWVDRARLRGVGEEAMAQLVRALGDLGVGGLPGSLARDLGRLAGDGTAVAVSWVPNSELSRLRVRVMGSPAAPP